MTFALRNLHIVILPVMFLVAPSLAQEGAGDKLATQKSKLSYESVADQLGLKRPLVEEAMTTLAAKGVIGESAVTYLLVAQHRVRRLVTEAKIEKGEEEKEFRATIGQLLDRYYGKKGGKSLIAEENDLTVSDTVRKVKVIVKQATITDTPVKRKQGSRTSQFPEHLASSLVKRFRVREQGLRDAWAELQRVPLQEAVKLLILADARSNRLVQAGAVPEEAREKSFFASVKFFLDQYERRLAWDELGIQEGKHTYQLHHESEEILGQRPKAPEHEVREEKDR